MVVQVPFESLPEDVRDAIERGDSVEFARDEDVVARIECADGKAGSDRHAEYLRRLETEPRVDYEEFLADLERVREELNRPSETPSWAPSG